MNYILLVLIFISSISFSQNKSQDLSQSNSNSYNDLKKEVEHGNQVNELKIQRLETKIDDNYREIEKSTSSAKESIENRMDVYLFSILGLLGLLAFLGNFFGAKAIKNRVESVIQEKAEKYASTKIDEEIKKIITKEYVNSMIFEKGQDAIKELISKLEKEGKDILINQERVYKEKLSELEKMKIDISRPISTPEKEMMEEFSKALKKAKTENEYTAEDWLVEGNKAYDNDKYIESISLYNKAINIRPDYAWAYNNRGNAYHAIEDLDNAISDYNKAIEISPTYSTPYNNKGIAYRSVKDYKKAIECFNKAIEISSDYSSAYANRSNVYFLLNDYSMAIKDLQKAVELSPEKAAYRIDLGVIYLNMKEYEKSIGALCKAIELDPENTTAYNSLTEVYIICENFIEAESIIIKSKEFQKKIKDKVVYYFLASVVAICQNKDVLFYENELTALLNSKPKLTWRFDELGKWLEFATIDTLKLNYIKNKIEILTKFK